MLSFQISVYDSGPKLMALGTASSNAHKTFDIRVGLARDYGRKKIILDEARLAENPVDRLSRMIKNSFWNHLTRRIDPEGLEVICADPKNRSRSKGAIIYIPYGLDAMAEHYREM
jgi:alpha,alpha-trehalase